jgi:hypothetical protein
MSIIEPTVGRAVWFRPVLVNGIGRAAPHKADIVAVLSDDCVNLSIFNEFGEHYTRSSVRLKQEGDTDMERPYAEWMPHQIGQAAKHEMAAPETADMEPVQQTGDREQGPIKLIQAPDIVINAHNVYFERN